jgi:hypothetical protein
MPADLTAAYEGKPRKVYDDDEVELSMSVTKFHT